jgi:NADH:ubiquinone oxidoreductase subunit H
MSLAWKVLLPIALLNLLVTGVAVVVFNLSGVQ